MGTGVDHYNINHDRLMPGTVVHIQGSEVALLLLDEKRRDGGNWYAMYLLNPPVGVHQ